MSIDTLPKINNNAEAGLTPWDELIDFGSPELPRSAQELPLDYSQPYQPDIFDYMAELENEEQ
ncbi:hypothetical protein CR969_00530 [Candidatus Saccharibacteria bacterium]|nr:MAG: hypothetical protein CR969_00530 [Candidatus Saccharibacteria bacterium]